MLSPSAEGTALTCLGVSRFEIDADAAYPIAEGVATSRPGFVPATELVFSGEGGLRYLYYPDALAVSQL